MRFGFLTAVVACALSTGLAVVTATVLAVDTLRADSGTNNLTMRFYLLSAGTLSGTLVAAYAAWRLLGPLSSTYRRGGLAIVCAFATVLLMLVCIPVNQLLGRAGLFVLLAASGLASALLARRAKRLGAPA